MMCRSVVLGRYAWYPKISSNPQKGKIDPNKCRLFPFGLPAVGARLHAVVPQLFAECEIDQASRVSELGAVMVALCR